MLVHIPDKGQVTTRYDGWYANRPRGMRRQAEPATADAPPAIVPTPRLAPTEANRRWAALLQQIFEVDPLACPTCRGPRRIIAFITQPSVIDQILTHLRTRASAAAPGGARSPPSTRRPSGPGAVRRPAPAHPAHGASPRPPAHVRGRSGWAMVPRGTAVLTAHEARRRGGARGR